MNGRQAWFANIKIVFPSLFGLVDKKKLVSDLNQYWHKNTLGQDIHCNKKRKISKFIHRT
jgi:hypothetical protein